MFRTLLALIGLLSWPLLLLSLSFVGGIVSREKAILEAQETILAEEPTKLVYSQETLRHTKILTGEKFPQYWQELGYPEVPEAELSLLEAYLVEVRKSDYSKALDQAREIGERTDSKEWQEVIEITESLTSKSFALQASQKRLESLQDGEKAQIESISAVRRDLCDVLMLRSCLAQSGKYSFYQLELLSGLPVIQGLEDPIDENRLRTQVANLAGPEVELSDLLDKLNALKARSSRLAPDFEQIREEIEELQSEIELQKAEIDSRNKKIYTKVSAYLLWLTQHPMRDVVQSILHYVKERSAAWSS